MPRLEPGCSSGRRANKRVRPYVPFHSHAICYPVRMEECDDDDDDDDGHDDDKWLRRIGSDPVGD